MTSSPPTAEPQAALEAAAEDDGDRGSYPWAQSADERRRCFVFEMMANADIDGAILVRNMTLACDWIETGAPPPKEEQRRPRPMK